MPKALKSFPKSNKSPNLSHWFQPTHPPTNQSIIFQFGEKSKNEYLNVSQLFTSSRFMLSLNHSPPLSLSHKFFFFLSFFRSPSLSPSSQIFLHILPLFDEPKKVWQVKVKQKFLYSFSFQHFLTIDLHLRLVSLFSRHQCDLKLML